MHQEGIRHGAFKKEKKKSKVPWLFKRETKHGLVKQKYKLFIVLEQRKHRQRRGRDATDSWRRVSNTMSQIFTLYHRMHSHYTALLWVVYKLIQVCLWLTGRKGKRQAKALNCTDDLWLLAGTVAIVGVPNDFFCAAVTNMTHLAKSLYNWSIICIL